jgi:uncharacterized protein (DUF1810 family)
VDSFHLERFVAAQDQAGTYLQALDELRRGRKVSHWMWFVFPQLAGLGRSMTAQRYAIGSRREALAYLSHSVLGPRLVECATAVDAVHGRTAEQIFGGVDALKLHSSMTLFDEVAPEQAVFDRVLQHYFSGDRDQATLRLIDGRPPQP